MKGSPRGVSWGGGGQNLAGLPDPRAPSEGFNNEHQSQNWPAERQGQSIGKGAGCQCKGCSGIPNKKEAEAGKDVKPQPTKRKSKPDSAEAASIKKEAESGKAEEPQPTKRKWKQDSELTRTQLRARAVSRAYHRALDEALASDKSKDAGKKLASAAHAKAAKEFDVARGAAEGQARR